MPNSISMVRLAIKLLKNDFDPTHEYPDSSILISLVSNTLCKSCLQDNRHCVSNRCQKWSHQNNIDGILL